MTISVTMKMGEGKEHYLNLTFEETGSTVTTNAQIVLDRQLVRNEYWYNIILQYIVTCIA